MFVRYTYVCQRQEWLSRELCLFQLTPHARHLLTHTLHTTTLTLTDPPRLTPFPHPSRKEITQRTNSNEEYIFSAPNIHTLSHALSALNPIPLNTHSLSHSLQLTPPVTHSPITAAHLSLLRRQPPAFPLRLSQAMAEALHLLPPAIRFDSVRSDISLCAPANGAGARGGHGAGGGREINDKDKR